MQRVNTCSLIIISIQTFHCGRQCETGKLQSWDDWLRGEHGGKEAEIRGDDAL